MLSWEYSRVAGESESESESEGGGGGSVELVMVSFYHFFLSLDVQQNFHPSRILSRALEWSDVGLFLFWSLLRCATNLGKFRTRVKVFKCDGILSIHG